MSNPTCIGCHAETSTEGLCASCLSRKSNFKLQRTAQHLLGTKGVLEGLEHGGDYHRLCVCYSRRSGTWIDTVYNRKSKRAHYENGLIACGDGWSCFWCGDKKQRESQEAIKEFFDYAYSAPSEENGFDEKMKVSMVTITTPHNAGDNFEVLIKAFNKAYSALMSSDSVRKLKREAGLKNHTVTSCEAPVGCNGLNWHKHGGWKVKRSTDTSTWKKVLTDEWAKICSKPITVELDWTPKEKALRKRMTHGEKKAHDKTKRKATWTLLKPHRTKSFAKYAIDVMDTAHSSDYLAKQNDNTSAWGVDAELSLQIKKMKKTKKELLALLGEKNEFKTFHHSSLLHIAEYEKGKGFNQAAIQYIECVNALRGRSMITFGKGLKNDIRAWREAVEAKKTKDEAKKAEEEDPKEDNMKGDVNVVAAKLGYHHWKLIKPDDYSKRDYRNEHLALTERTYKHESDDEAFAKAIVKYRAWYESKGLMYITPEILEGMSIADAQEQLDGVRPSDEEVARIRDDKGHIANVHTLNPFVCFPVAIGAEVVGAKQNIEVAVRELERAIASRESWGGDGASLDEIGLLDLLQSERDMMGPLQNHTRGYDYYGVLVQDDTSFFSECADEWFESKGEKI